MDGLKQDVTGDKVIISRAKLEVMEKELAGLRAFQESKTILIRISNPTTPFAFSIWGGRDKDFKRTAPAVDVKTVLEEIDVDVLEAFTKKYKSATEELQKTMDLMAEERKELDIESDKLIQFVDYVRKHVHGLSLYIREHDKWWRIGLKKFYVPHCSDKVFTIKGKDYRI